MKAPRSTTNEVHQRTHTIQLEWDHIQRILALAAADSVEFLIPCIDAPGVKSKVTIEDETHGSPGYRVGIRAKVVITEDLQPPSQDEQLAHGGAA